MKSSISYITVFGRNAAENFIREHNEDPQYRKTILSQFNGHQGMDGLNPEDFAACGPYELTNAWRLGYGINDDGKQICYEDRIYTVLIDRESDRAYGVRIHRDRKISIYPVDWEKGEYIDIPEEQRPNRFSKPTDKTLRKWIDACDEAIREYEEEKTRVRELMLNQFDSFRKAFPDMKILAVKDGIATKFSVKVTVPVEIIYEAADNGIYYRDVKRHEIHVPSTEELLARNEILPTDAK